MNHCCTDPVTDRGVMRMRRGYLHGCSSITICRCDIPRNASGRRNMHRRTHQALRQARINGQMTMRMTISKEAEVAMVSRVPQILGVRIGKVLRLGNGIMHGNGTTEAGTRHPDGKEGGSKGLPLWQLWCHARLMEQRRFRGKSERRWAVW